MAGSGSGARGDRAPRPRVAPDDRGLADGLTHNAVKPAWDCEDCGTPWPCDPARIWFRETYSPAMVGRMLNEMSVRAARDTNMPPSELYERFVAWTLP
jgi:hypothetical protein